VLVIGVGSTSTGERAASDSGAWPSVAQIAGHMLDAIFTDTLDTDLERLQRVNQTLACVREDTGWRSNPELKAIDTLVIRPTEQMDSIAASHARELPQAMRFVARRIGVLDPKGASMLSYLLFESGYCRHLINLGYSDGMGRRCEILDFLGYGHSVGAKPRVPQRHRRAHGKAIRDPTTIPEQSLAATLISRIRATKN
jgi:NTE family protein